jgi:hypothetical protein
MNNVLVRILRLVEDGQPPILECELEDAAGRRHTFVDKEPIFAVKSPTGYPQVGFIRCEVLKTWKDRTAKLWLTSPPCDRMASNRLPDWRNSWFIRLDI